MREREAAVEPIDNVRSPRSMLMTADDISDPGASPGPLTANRLREKENIMSKLILTLATLSVVAAAVLPAFYAFWTIT